jgi:hypothetical protein
MVKRVIKTDTSLQGVVEQAALSIVTEYMSIHPEVLLRIVQRVTGKPLDGSKKGMPPEGKLVLDGISTGAGIVLHGILSGQLDIALIKRRIK